MDKDINPISPSSRRSAASSTMMHNTHRQRQPQQPAGMDGILAERMADGGGALCNDENGLCLGSRGDIDASKSGVYTSIAKLASQLDNTIDGSGHNMGNEVPLVSIQTDEAALLVKEYGGRTVVFRVPAQSEPLAGAVNDSQTSEKEHKEGEIGGSGDAASNENTNV